MKFLAIDSSFNPINFGGEGIPVEKLDLIQLLSVTALSGQNSLKLGGTAA